MIYKVFLIDGDAGILILEKSFKEFNKSKNLKTELLTDFFKEVNKMIDDIQDAMTKGKGVDDTNRIISGDYSTIIMYYHPLSHVLFCSISDEDDDKEKLIEILQNFGLKFYEKHEKDLKKFRKTSEKNYFLSFIDEIDALSVGGRGAEILPKLIIAKNVLERIKNMGIINNKELKIALECNGKSSPLRISRNLNTIESKIRESLKKLENLEIIKL